MKFLSYVFVFIFLLGLASAATYQQSTDIHLIQTCNNCTYCNITKLAQTSPTSIVLFNNEEMTKDKTSYNFTIDSSNTGNIGNYEWCYDCGNEDEIAVGCIEFKITRGGWEATTSEGIVYLVAMVIILFIFLLSLYGAITIPWKNKRNAEGVIVGINDLKWVKLVLWMVSYFLLIFFFAIAKGMAENFMLIDIAGKTFNFIFWALIAMLLPILVAGTIIGAVTIVSDKKLYKKIKRGFEIR